MFCDVSRNNTFRATEMRRFLFLFVSLTVAFFADSFQFNTRMASSTCRRFHPQPWSLISSPPAHPVRAFIFVAQRVQRSHSSSISIDFPKTHAFLALSACQMLKKSCVRVALCRTYQAVSLAARLSISLLLASYTPLCWACFRFF